MSKAVNIYSFDSSGPIILLISCRLEAIGIFTSFISSFLLCFYWEAIGWTVSSLLPTCSPPESASLPESSRPPLWLFLLSDWPRNWSRYPRDGCRDWPVCQVRSESCNWPRIKGLSYEQLSLLSCFRPWSCGWGHWPAVLSLIQSRRPAEALSRRKTSWFPKLVLCIFTAQRLLWSICSKTPSLRSWRWWLCYGWFLSWLSHSIACTCSGSLP